MALSENRLQELELLTQEPEKDRETVINEMSSRLGVSPDWVNNIINFESKGGDPQAANPLSSAKGLIQFTDNTARALGYGSSQELVTKNPTFESQVWNAVFPYLSQFKPKTEEDFYLSVFQPASMGEDLDQEFPDYIKRANPGINTPRDYINKVRGVKPAKVEPKITMSDDRFMELEDLATLPETIEEPLTDVPKTVEGFEEKPVVEEPEGFQAWYSQRAEKLGLNPDPDAPEHFYDYRAAFKAGAEPDESGHWPSQFKKEGHPDLVKEGIDTRTGEPVEFGTTEGLPPALAEAKPLPEDIPPSAEAPRKEYAPPDVAKGTVSLVRNLAAKGLEDVVGMGSIVTRVVVSGIGGAVEDLIQSGGDVNFAMEGFMQGLSGKRDVFGKSSQWWEEHATDWAETIRGEAKTKSEEFQQQMANDMLNAYYILSGGTALLKAIPKSARAVKVAAQSVVNKAKLNSKVLKTLKLTPDELIRVKEAHVGAKGMTAASLSAKERAFLKAITESSENIAGKALKSGEIKEILYPWEKPNFRKVPKPTGKELRLPAPKGKVPPAKGVAPTDPGFKRGVPKEQITKSQAVDDMVENLLAEGGIYTKEMIRKGKVPVSEKVITPTKETKFVSKGIAEVAPRRVPTEAELAKLPKPPPEPLPPAKKPKLPKPIPPKPVVKKVPPKPVVKKPKILKKEPALSEAGFIQLPTMDVFKTPKQKVPEAAKKIHEKWVGDKQVQLLESDRAINKIQQTVKGKEQEVIPFLIERTGIPKELNRPDLEKIIKDPAKKQRLVRVAEESKKHMNEVFQYVKKHRPDMSEYELENYVTHIWDVPKNKVKEAVNWFTTYDPFLKKRFIETLSAGIKKGYKPKTLNIVEIMKIHDQYHIKTTENIRLVEALKQLQDDQGIKLIQRADRAPVDWVTSDHPVLRRALFIPGDPAVVARVPVKYHPDLDPLMKSVFGKKITATPIQIYEVFNGVMKQTQLSLSLFHHAALTETAVATIGPVQTAKILGNVKGLYNALARNKFDIYEKKFEVAKDGVKHGLQIGAITDVQRGLVTKMLQGLEDKLNVYHKGLGLPAKALRKGKELWDKGLWDYLHNNFKVYAYENLKTKSIAGLKNPTDADITVVKKEVAQMVNDTFGGQNWERMMTDPRNLQIAQWALLSPDWTFSTVRQALAPTGIGRVAKEGAKLRRKMGAAFWARAAFYFYGGINMLNFALSKYDNAKERGVSFKKGNGVFMWQNDPGHKTHLMVGRYPDGSKRYIRWGKQFRELPELFYDQTAAQISPITATLRKLGSKAAPNLQLLSTIFTGKSIGGFKNRELANKTGWTWVGAAAKEIIKAPLPFAFKNTINESKQFKFTDLAFPSSKGMSYFKAKKLFKIAVVKRNLKYVANIYKASVENNLNANDIFSDAITELKREATAEVSRKVRLGKITEPTTIKELKALTRNERRELERKVMLENWEILMLSAEERYQRYLVEKQMEEEPFGEEEK